MPEKLYSPSAVKEILNERGLSPSKKLGQNFLTDYNTIEKIANTVPAENRSERAFEIGAGLGALSHALSKRYKSLSCVEFDSGLFRFLYENAAANSAIIHSDVLKTSIETGSDVYGNIPYNISSQILQWLLIENNGKWNFAVFLVQKDFAQRICASPGESSYSPISLLAAFASDIKIEFSVGKNVFLPKPKIDSAVISIKPTERFDIDAFPSYRRLVRSAFHNRRKTAVNNFIKSPYLSLSKNDALKLLSAIGADPRVRGEELSPDEYFTMSRLLAEQDQPPAQ